MQTSAETFFRASKFHKGGDGAPPVFMVDGVSYLSIKVRGGARQPRRGGPGRTTQLRSSIGAIGDSRKF